MADLETIVMILGISMFGGLILYILIDSWRNDDGF